MRALLLLALITVAGCDAAARPHVWRATNAPAPTARNDDGAGERSPLLRSGQDEADMSGWRQLGGERQAETDPTRLDWPRALERDESLLRRPRSGEEFNDTLRRPRLGEESGRMTRWPQPDSRL